MRTNNSRGAAGHSHRGVALVIVLAFVLLLSGLIIAFFSRAISDRQISNSGANQVKVDLLARGAIDTTLGDLQQEIAAGSTPFVLPAPTPAQGGATLFIPNSSATVVPAQVFPSPTPANAVSGLENLLKESVGGQPFYPTPSASINYKSYSPSARAAKSTTGTGATGDNSTFHPSLNGRYVSMARWNKALLMPATAATDYTPVISGGGSFVPPDWVLVTRDGSNGGGPATPGIGPTSWSNSFITSATNSTSVVGRYAYAMYDEGGVLDANVAGYPTGAYPADPTNPPPSPLPIQPTRKSSLAYADLTVPVTTPSGTTQPLMTAQEINSLVGWRNYASGQPSGSFPSYTPAPTPSAGLTPFDIATLLVSSGYLSVSNSKLYNNASDRMFGTRQQLIDLLLQGVATSDAERVALQNSLRYLGTFSRGLSQPSFYKTQGVDNTVPGYDSTAPVLLTTTLGGNNAAPDNNGGMKLDAIINPSFLNVRVKSTAPGKLRNDGSAFVLGEPLVKRRFSLNRLAWLTFAGPIASHDGSTLNPTGNSEVATIISALENTYGFTDAFLKQGTDTNIQNYFGLSWGTDPTNTSANCWLYNVHNRGGATGPIRKLDASKVSPPETADVLNANREADFFELLKAAVNVGSLAKVATVISPDPDYAKLVASYQTQYADDYRVDDALIQMGANIIDQFDLDGYPTCINFNDGGTTNGKDFHGVENLPYLSRVAHALVKVKQVNPAVAVPATGAITDTGVGALLQCPVLWNPHDYNTTNVNQTFGVVGPQNFRVYADSSAYPVNNTALLWGIDRDQPTGSNQGHNHYYNADTTKSQSWHNNYGFPFSPTVAENRTLTLSNTALYFSVNKDATRFREPTVLYQTTSSGGYVDPTKLPARGGYGIIGNTAAFFAGDGGFKSDVGSGLSGIPPVQGQGYVGFYVGAIPLYWADSSQSGHPFAWTDEVAVVNPDNIDYHLQYQDNTTLQWTDYDVKRRTTGGGGAAESPSLSSGGDRSPAANGWESFLYPATTGTNFNYYDASYAAMDPRSSRFGLVKITAGKQDSPYWTYAPYAAGSPATATRVATASTVGFTNGWVNPGSGIILGLRSGTSDGTPFMCPVGVFPTSMGWNPGSPESASTGQRFVACDNSTSSIILGQTTGNHMCRPGIFSQNNPFARRDNRPMGDDGDAAALYSPPPGVSNAAQFYTDADGVVRRATGGLVPFSSSGQAASSDIGLSMTPANQAGTTRLSQSDSRPVVLNRPFRTVGELGYTFAGTPWKNIDFDMPESGDTALLDVFCVNDTDDPNGLVAGKVNLNTRQAPVLQAILSAAYKDEWNAGTAALMGTLPANIAAALVARTTGKGPLQNVSELVGKWTGNAGTTGMSGGASSPIFSPRCYDGFSADLVNNTVTPATGVLVTSLDANLSIPRFADATMRALAAAGQTRVWNLLIDVIAQTGRYPQSATSFSQFAVEGEQRYWVHVAIDRLTGQVIDEQLEVVKE